METKETKVIEVKTFDEIMEDQKNKEEKEIKLPYTAAEMYALYVGKKDKFTQLEILLDLNGLKHTEKNLQIIKDKLISCGIDKDSFPDKPLKIEETRPPREIKLPYSDEEILDMYFEYGYIDIKKRCIKIAKICNCYKKGKVYTTPIKKALVRAGIDPVVFPKSKAAETTVENNIKNTDVV